MAIPIEEGWESVTQLSDQEHLAFVVFWLSSPARGVKSILLFCRN